MAGKKGRSGRKSKAEELGLSQLFDTCWPLKDREETVKKLAAMAKRGNMQAIQILFAYAYGKPTEHHEHSGMGGSEIIFRVIRDDRVSSETEDAA